MDLNDCRPGLLVTSTKDHMIFVYDQHDGNIIGSFTFPQVALVVEISYPGEVEPILSPRTGIPNWKTGKWAKVITPAGVVGWSLIFHFRTPRFRRVNEKST